MNHAALRRLREFVAWSILLGPYGGHRYRNGRTLSAVWMTVLAIVQVQIFIHFFTVDAVVAQPALLWPPYCAALNAMTILNLEFPPTARPLDMEASLVAPAIVILTIPSMILTAWALFDAAKDFREQICTGNPK